MKKVVVICGGIAAVTVLSYACTRVRAHAMTHCLIAVTGDEHFSSDFANALEKIIKKTFDAKTPTRWMSDLRKRFNLIDHVICAKQDYGVLAIGVYGVPLRFVVNGAIVVDRVGNQHARSYIADQAFAALPQIRVEPAQLQRPELALFARTVPEEWLTTYRVTWHTPYDIRLRALDDTYEILARYDYLPTLDVLAHVAPLVSAQQADSKKHRTVVVDTRFEGQLIVNKGV